MDIVEKLTDLHWKAATADHTRHEVDVVCREALAEIEAWRRTNPQYFYDPSADAIFRHPETLPPHMRPARN